ncbi:MAG: hypothetical protein HYY10_03360 [Candidatus Liptonbacteria bacterium]|nr:hypothetical protein [Candidatus Liptonbacteria bacterium]
MNKRLKLLGGAAGVFAAQSFFAASAFAQQPISPLNVSDVSGVIGLIVKVGDRMFELLIVLSIIMIMVAAYKYLTAGSDAEKVTSAHKTITWAAVAIVVALLAKGFPAIVRSVFGDSGSGAASVAVTAPLPPAQVAAPVQAAPGVGAPQVTSPVYTRPNLPPAGTLTPSGAQGGTSF